MNVKIISIIYCISIVFSFSASAESVCFYQGNGVGPVSANQLLEFIKRETDDRVFEVKTSGELIHCLESEANKTQISIVIPGGNTAVISKSLRKSFNEIRNSIQLGATYLGICAGAHLATSGMYFDSKSFYDSQFLLSLIPAHSYVFSHPILQHVSQGRFVNIVDDSNSTFKVFWNRGGYFDDLTSNKINPIAQYIKDKSEDLNTNPFQEDSLAILTTQFGNGTVIASQVHLELGMLTEIPKNEYEDFYQHHAHYATEQFILRKSEIDANDEITQSEIQSKELLRRLLQHGNFSVKKRNY